MKNKENNPKLIFSNKEKNKMKHLVIVITVIILISAYPVSLLAQNTDDGSSPKLRRWTVSLYLAGTMGGPAKDVEKAMVAGGFNQTSTGLFGGLGRSHPFSRRGPQYYGEYTYMIGISYIFKSPFAAGIIASRADLGETRGYRDPFLWLSPRYSVSTVAPIVSVQAKWFHFGIGPALHYAKSTQENGGKEVSRKSIRKYGFIIDFGLTIPRKSRFFVELKAQYRAVGQVKIGPYEASSLDNSAILPVTKVNYNHWFIGLGVGIRL